MYRVRPLIQRCILSRCNPITSQTCCLTSSPVLRYEKKIQERQTCPQPKKLLRPAKNDTLFWSTIAAMIVALIFAGYARNKPEIRDWLSVRAPWFDNFIAMIYEENLPIPKFMEVFFESVRDKIKDMMVEKECVDGKLVPLPMDPCLTKDEGKEVEPSEVDKCVHMVPTTNVCEVENCLWQLCEATLNNLITARDAAAFVIKETEQTLKVWSLPLHNELIETMKEQRELINVSVKNFTEAEIDLAAQKQYFECALRAPVEAKNATRAMLKNYDEKIAFMRNSFNWENLIFEAYEEAIQLLSALVFRYEFELENLFPGTKLRDERPTFKGNPDVLVVHAIKYVRQLTEDLCWKLKAFSLRIQRLFDGLPESDKDKATYRYGQKKGENSLPYKLGLVKDINKKHMDDTLKRQQDQFEANLPQMIKDAEITAEKTLRRRIDEAMIKERACLKQQWLEMKCKVDEVQQKLDDKLKAERDTRNSQILYAAGASLLAATKKGDEIVDVTKEIKAIERIAGEGDKLVQAILKAIPDTVKSRGVVPESTLKSKFLSMERTAMGVALVESEGSPLIVYIVSWIQSLFIFMRLSSIPYKELENPREIKEDEFDTFDLLQRARYFVDRNELGKALRYLEALKGASRVAALTWFMNARAHIELRQAAEAVLAHAQSLAIQNL